MAIGDFLVALQLFLHRLAVDCKTAKHIISKAIEYVTENFEIMYDGYLITVLIACEQALRGDRKERKGALLSFY